MCSIFDIVLCWKTLVFSWKIEAALIYQYIISLLALDGRL